MPVLVVLSCVAACWSCVSKCICHLCNKELLYFLLYIQQWRKAGWWLWSAALCHITKVAHIVTKVWEYCCWEISHWIAVVLFSVNYWQIIQCYFCCRFMHRISRTTFMVLVRRRPSWDLRRHSLVRHNVARNFMPQLNCSVSQKGAPQWLKCNGMQGNAVPPPTIYVSKCSPTSDC